MGIVSIRNARDHKAALREIDELLAVKKLTEEQSRRLDAPTPMRRRRFPWAASIPST